MTALIRERYFKDECVEMWIEDGIIQCLFSSGLVITEEIATSIVRERIRISEGGTYPGLIDTTPMRYITQEARAYLAKGDGIRCLSAGAFLINSKVQAIFVNFFLMINKPAIPAKLFTDRKKAIFWLQQFKG
jgi:hypothetical protein